MSSVPEWEDIEWEEDTELEEDSEEDRDLEESLLNHISFPEHLLDVDLDFISIHCVQGLRLGRTSLID
ncbi:hypothetical protein DUI87_01637 [Hirundo rustica rustica]|uniref:Uncharacterized protein n=1 Tax=Hirundo rustica rustica TaxID=333673 RepID=A0A3M0L5V9_HIRRU|nr:hypothetical protein DUI87_01637 [Hirundo rustica rustica]